MKYFLILGLCLLTIVPSCKKSTGSTTYMTSATITGQDMTMTPCSGGYFITIDGLSAVSRFYALPAGSNIDLSIATFPINVKLKWHHPAGDPSPCNVIIVDAIVKN